MKCPYRIDKSVASNGGYIEDYAECYGNECPFYVPESKWSRFTVSEACGRTITNKTIKELLMELKEGGENGLLD